MHCSRKLSLTLGDSPMRFPSSVRIPYLNLTPPPAHLHCCLQRVLVCQAEEAEEGPEGGGEDVAHEGGLEREGGREVGGGEERGEGRREGERV